MTAWMTLKPWEPLSVTLSEEARSSSYSNSDGSQKAAGFAVTHIRADYTLGHGFSVNASVNNLFDTKYATVKGLLKKVAISGQVSSIRSDVKADSGICIAIAL